MFTQIGPAPVRKQITSGPEVIDSEVLMVRVLESAAKLVAAVRARHEGIPEIVLVGGTTGRKGMSQTHGHFHANQWTTRKAGESPVHEIYLSGESLARGGRATAGTVIHELAHAFAFANGIKDTSNVGRYHNKRFKEIAERFGLEISQAPVIGFSVTTLPDDTYRTYRDEIDALGDAIQGHRAGAYGRAFTGGGGIGGGSEPGGTTAAAGPKRARLKMGCPECGEYTPVSNKWWDSNGDKIQCVEHGCAFDLKE